MMMDMEKIQIGHGWTQMDTDRFSNRRKIGGQTVEAKRMENQPQMDTDGHG